MRRGQRIGTVNFFVLKEFDVKGKQYQYAREAGRKNTARLLEEDDIKKESKRRAATKGQVIE